MTGSNRKALRHLGPEGAERLGGPLECKGFFEISEQAASGRRLECTKSSSYADIP
jgi:hypothetical protein